MIIDAFNIAFLAAAFLLRGGRAGYIDIYIYIPGRIHWREISQMSPRESSPLSL